MIKSITWGYSLRLNFVWIAMACICIASNFEVQTHMQPQHMQIQLQSPHCQLQTRDRAADKHTEDKYLNLPLCLE